MFNPFKTDLTVLIGLSRDALHIHLGLMVFLLAMVVFRRSPASIVPWACVLALELINELFDLFHVHDGTMEFSVPSAIADVVNTMLWPTVILLLARFGPQAWRRPS